MSSTHCKSFNPTLWYLDFLDSMLLLQLNREKYCSFSILTFCNYETLYQEDRHLKLRILTMCVFFKPFKKLTGNDVWTYWSMIKSSIIQDKSICILIWYVDIRKNFKLKLLDNNTENDVKKIAKNEKMHPYILRKFFLFKKKLKFW